MRERGITRPALKAVLAAAMAMAGAGALLWSGAGAPVPPGPSPAGPSIRPLAVVALVIGTLMLANYLYVWSLVRRLRSGDGVIGRWTVTAAEFARFRDAERARTTRRNNWRMPRSERPDGLPVIFSVDAVLVGETWFRLAGRGMSRFTHARIEHGAVPSIEFSMTLTVIGAGTQGRTARYRGQLRVPIATDAGAEAARVTRHFREMAG